MNSSLENSPATPEIAQNSEHFQDFQLLSELEHLNAIKFNKNLELPSITATNPVFHQIQVQYENTYSLEPAKGVPNTEKLRKILKNLISNELSDFSGRYSSFTAKYYCRIVADLIKNEVKDRVDTRYKIITYVHIGENNGQDLSIKSSFLWDAERDRHVDFSLKIDNKESGDTRTGMFLVAKVFFLYYD